MKSLSNNVYKKLKNKYQDDLDNIEGGTLYTILIKWISKITNHILSDEIAESVQKKKKIRTPIGGSEVPKKFRLKDIPINDVWVNSLLNDSRRSLDCNTFLAFLEQVKQNILVGIKKFCDPIDEKIQELKDESGPLGVLIDIITAGIQADPEKIVEALMKILVSLVKPQLTQFIHGLDAIYRVYQQLMVQVCQVHMVIESFVNPACLINCPYYGTNNNHRLESYRAHLDKLIIDLFNNVATINENTGEIEISSDEDFYPTILKIYDIYKRKTPCGILRSLNINSCPIKVLNFQPALDIIEQVYNQIDTFMGQFWMLVDTAIRACNVLKIDFNREYPRINYKMLRNRILNNEVLKKENTDEFIKKQRKIQLEQAKKEREIVWNQVKEFFNRSNGPNEGESEEAWKKRIAQEAKRKVKEIYNNKALQKLIKDNIYGKCKQEYDNLIKIPDVKYRLELSEYTKNYDSTDDTKITKEIVDGAKFAHQYLGGMTADEVIELEMQQLDT